MATNPAVTGPSVWLQLVQQEVENAGIDNAGGDNPSNDLADPIFTDLADHSDMSRGEDPVLPSPELEMENNAIDNAGASTIDIADPIFTDFADSSDTSNEEDPATVLPSLELEMDSYVVTHVADNEDELVLPPISVPRYFNSTSSVEDNGFDALHLGPSELIREESEDDSNVTHICRNGCSPDDENTDTVTSLDTLVELGCQCRGSMSRMCIMCLLKWFGPRIMLEKDTTCEVCQTRLNESVKKTVMRALADHTGGREILIEALGPRLVRAHNAREGLGRVDPVVEPVEEDDAVNENELTDVPSGSAHASLVRVVAAPPDAPPDAPPAPPDAPPAPPATPVSPSTPAPDRDSPGLRLPVSAPIQHQRRSFWTKIRRYMCCATPPPVLGPH